MSKRVYKFLSAKHAVDNIENSRIKISTIDDLNDPFDLAAVDSTDHAIRDALTESIASFKRTVGLLCFSRNWDNILLWSHYGLSHTGICLGFDIDDAQPDGDIAVSYQPHMLTVRGPEEVDSELVMKVLRTKYEVWSYEQEIRLFIELNAPPDEKGLHWIEFGDALVLKEIVVGAQSSPEDVGKVIQIHKPYRETVELAWAGLRKDAFSLVRMASPPPWQVAIALE